MRNHFSKFAKVFEIFALLRIFRILPNDLFVLVRDVRDPILRNSEGFSSGYDLISSVF